MNNVELNITYRCNLKCSNCNRLCNLLRLDEDMTVEQVLQFFQKLRDENQFVRRLAVLGGEPTIHKDFFTICSALSEAIKEGIILRGEVVTNTKPPKFKIEDNIHWRCSPPNKKSHRPFLWSPKDLGLITKGPCWMTWVCGLSLDSRGWLPCSSAPALVHLFGLWDLYMPLSGPLPKKVWGMKTLCKDCIFSAKLEELKAKKFVDSPSDWNVPSPCFSKALEKYMLENPGKVRKCIS